MLNKYKEIYDIYGLTNAQIEMNTGLSAKLYDIDRKFFV